ncbi:MarR family transcriptional regulator [Amycolatopsis ultiminotia]|uniref:MarR family transcriptional regulator n=1 Tax=Amycolatopsis ultiminotia TaxID=543629 RepID=A0ABP6WIX5_9PSEU
MREHDQGRDDVTEAFDEVVRLMIRHLADHGTLTELAAVEGTSQPSRSQLVQRLERQGLVRRVKDPHDGRASLIALSDAGRTPVATRLRDRRDRLAELLGTLSPEDDASLRLAMNVARPIIQRLIETARRSDKQAGS